MVSTPWTDQLLGAFPVLRTDDLDAARHAVAGRFCDHRLTLDGGKGVSVRHNHVGGAHISLNMLGYGGDVAIDPGMLGDFYLLQIPLTGTALIAHRGEEVCAAPERATILNPDRPTRMQWRADCRKLLVQIDERFLHRVAEEAVGAALPGPVRFDPAIDLRARAGRKLRMLALTMVGAADEGRLFTGRPGLRDMSTEREFVRLLLTLQPSNVAHMMRPDADAARPVHLRRAVDFIHGHYAEPICLDDIAASAGVHPRNLQIGFKKAFGRSPIRYLRDVRLDAARYHLSARQNRESVTETAFACGFSHLGRFSRDYRARFGQLPSLSGEA
ncbi:MAG: AraC family transcriptional regulator [Phyllobacteriaceae bacterium]|nr:AraC family transcriptional regulator [Phyllobacteriaceae bacterium]